jgi:hypothetical protein
MRTLSRMGDRITRRNVSSVRKSCPPLHERIVCRLVIATIWLLTICACTTLHDVGAGAAGSDSAARLARAFEEHESGIQIEGEGKVTRLLSDDLEGSRHQRFILELNTGQTLLIAHNIDIAPRIETLQVGDDVGFSGVYEWNSKGGTIHWTHHDPNGHHVPGWLKHDGKVYQ